MFRDDHSEPGRVVHRATALARELGHPRTGSEHLLLALTTDDTLTTVLTEHGATPHAVRQAIELAAPAGAGVAADRDVLATLGIDVDRLLGSTGTALLDRPPAREPLLPLGAAGARQRSARRTPPLGLDAQAVYEASLRLALGRREREHRAAHLALALVALDPGAAWVLSTAGVDSAALLADLAAAFPPPHRGALLRAERRIGRRHRHHDIVRRYQHTTGRTANTGPAIAELMC
jgi:hypothetical protein